MSILLGMAAFLGVLLAGAVLYDWRRRHRHEPPHDIGSAASNTRQHAEGQGQPPPRDRMSGPGW
jgi:hypothetical protein